MSQLMGLKRWSPPLIFLLLLSSCAQPIDTKEIDLEITNLKAQAAEIQKEKQNYTGGLVFDLLTIRENIYKNTQAMLEQKKQGFNKIIKISYVVSGKVFDEAIDSSEEIKGLEVQIAEIKESIAAARKESAEYLGGYIKVTIEMRIAIENETIAMLEQKRLGLMYKIPMLMPSNDSNQPVRKTMRGETIDQL